MPSENIKPDLTPRTGTPVPVLLVGVTSGFGGMHLPRHLARTGLMPGFLGSQDCLAAHSGYIGYRHTWQRDESGQFRLAPLAEAVRQFHPRMLVPVDEASVELLQRIGIDAANGNALQVPPDLTDLIARSLGDPQGYALGAVRKAAYATACLAGIPAPFQTDAHELDAVLTFAHRHAYPLVMKREGSVGGCGVNFVNDESSLRAFFQQRMQDSPGRQWVAQCFASGRVGMHAVFAYDGKVLARVSAVQVTTRSKRVSAPSSVVQLIRHTAMEEYGTRFVAATGASGFHGWDFLLDAAGGAALIEHNPRLISITHLGGLMGDDLCNALATVCGLPSSQGVATGNGEPVVALFPDEWKRDPRSPMLYSSYHDVPWDEPAILVALIGSDFSFV